MIKRLIEIAKEAGKDILKVYSEDFSVFYKDDKSPLTEADKKANAVIMNGLKEFGLPVISEENKEIPHSERSNWERFFLVDPLDGTKEFVKKNGEFTVNIALIDEGRPVMGVVYAPVLDDVYYSDGENSYKNEKKLPIEGSHDPLRVVASKSHFSGETKEYIEKLGSYELVQKGSSLKLCAVASGEADIYPRLGPTMEWDTAAAHAVVLGAGKKVLDLKGQELVYNKKDLHNPWFVVK